VKGIKEFLKGLCFQTKTVVLNGKMHKISGRKLRGFLVGGKIVEGDGDLSATFVEVLPAMHTEVEKNLVDLRGIGADVGATGLNAGGEGDFVRDDAAENLEGFFDDGWQGNVVQDGGGALGKDADFVKEIAGAVAGFKNLFEGFVGGMAFVNIHRDEFGAAEDAGDDVVEFVGDAAGELVEGVEFLFEELGRLADGWGVVRRIFVAVNAGLDVGGGVASVLGFGWRVGGFHAGSAGGSVGDFFAGGDKKFLREDLSLGENFR